MPCSRRASGGAGAAPGDRSGRGPGALRAACVPTARLLAPLALAATAAGCADLVHVDPEPTPEALRRLLDDGSGGAPAAPAPLDVAIILGCPASEDGAVSPCERCRVDSALAAFRRGEVRAIIFSGAAVWTPFVEADVMADAAIAAGLPPAAALREPRALTTWMNLRFSQRLMHERGLRTALVISSASHLPRARRFAEWLGLAARYRACDRPAPTRADAAPQRR